MIALKFAIVGAFILLCLIAVTQILVPLFNGTPLFPTLRNSDEKKKLAEVENSLEEANELADIQNRITTLKDVVKSKLDNGNS